MQPLYFLAGVDAAVLAPGNRLNRTLLAARGLADVFADVSDAENVVSTLSGHGPEGKSGTVLSYLTPTGQAARRVGYYPDEQEWIHVGDDLWIGIDRSDLPTPEDLSRKKQFDGFLVELGDSQRYAIPVIRRPDGSTNLPRDMLTNPLTGRHEEPIKVRYAKYWEQSIDVADWFFNTGFDATSFTKEKGLALSIDALGLNYRYGPREQFVLRLIDSINYMAILGATVDLHGVVAAADQKKSGAAADLSTSPGPPDA